MISKYILIEIMLRDLDQMSGLQKTKIYIYSTDEKFVSIIWTLKMKI